MLLIIIRYSNISVYCKIVIFIYTIPLASNQVNTVNGMDFEYTGKDEIHLKVGRFDRIYFEDMFEYDPVNISTYTSLLGLYGKGFFNLTNSWLSLT